LTDKSAGSERTRRLLERLLPGRKKEHWVAGDRALSLLQWPACELTIAAIPGIRGRAWLAACRAGGSSGHRARHPTSSSAGLRIILRPPYLLITQEHLMKSLPALVRFRCRLDRSRDAAGSARPHPLPLKRCLGCRGEAQQDGHRCESGGGRHCAGPLPRQTGRRH
jgi:hypothetical protein